MAPNQTLPNQPPASPQPTDPSLQLAQASQDLETVETQALISHVTKYFPKIVAIALTAQGLFGIYKSVVFIFVKLPALEQALNLHQVTSTEISMITNQAILESISTIVSMFFALRITILKSKVAKRINIAIGILLVIFNALISDYFTQLNSGEIISVWLSERISTILGIFRQI